MGFPLSLKTPKRAQAQSLQFSLFKSPLVKLAYLGLPSSVLSHSKHVGSADTSSRHISQLFSFVGTIWYRCDTRCDTLWHHTILLVQSLRPRLWPTPCLLLSSKAYRTCRHVLQTRVSIIVTCRDNLLPSWHRLWRIMISYNSACTIPEAASSIHVVLALAIQSR